jgi:putative membrane protein
MKNPIANLSIGSLSIFLVWLFPISGMIGMSIGHYDWFIVKTPLNLLVLFALLLINFPIRSGKTIAISTLIFSTGFAVEWLGVHTGVLFGEYHYGQNLGMKIDGIPPLIGINWVILTLCSAAIAQHYFSNIWLKAALGAGLMVLLDFFIEPSAPLFDFWFWKIDHAPFQNFVAWFVVAFLLHLAYGYSKVKGSFRFCAHAFAAQAVFFIYFYFYHGV